MSRNILQLIGSVYRCLDSYCKHENSRNDVVFLKSFCSELDKLKYSLLEEIKENKTSISNLFDHNSKL